MTAHLRLVAAALAAALLLAPLAASAQDRSATVREFRLAELQTIVVTGTRASDRTLANALAPVDVLTAADLEDTHATNLAVALRMLLPSFNFPQPSILGASNATMPAQLRGLSPDQTLVLINGKRQHSTAIVNNGPGHGRGSSPVDLTAIPISAVARIEVLRDGAAAQYGSDAIAGVINIILKRGAEGGLIELTHGRHDSRHDGNRSGEQGATWKAGASVGLPLGNEGWLRLSGNLHDQDPTQHAGLDRRFATDPTYMTQVIRYGLPEEKAQMGAFNAEYPLNENTVAYAFGVFNRRKVSASASFRSLSEYKGSSPAAVERYPAGYLPMENSTIHDDQSVAGLRGQLGAWQYDFSLALGGSRWQLDTVNTINHSLGYDSPSEFHIGKLSIRQNEFSLDVIRDLPSLWDSPLTLAWGVSAREQSFTIQEGEPDSWAGEGAKVVAGFQPTDAGRHSRRNRAIYADLETDFTPSTSAGLAVRHERYSDFGNTTSWKLSGRQALTPALALRATASTGFRAPSLQQQFYSTTGVEFINVGDETFPYTIRTFPVSEPAAVALGAQPLKAEKSRNYSAGFVFAPSNGASVTLDLYQIDITDRIILSGNLLGPAVQDFLTSVGIPFVSGGRFFTNAVDTRTRGADLVGSLPILLENSSLALSAGVNWNRTHIRHTAPNPPQLGLVGLELPILDRDEEGRITVGAPRSAAHLGLDWKRDRWGVHSRLTHYGKWTSLGLNPDGSGDQTFSPRLLLDLSVSYASDHWRLSLGGVNVTNVYPEKNNAANDFAGNIAYPWSSPFGFSGAYWHATAAWTW